MSGKLKWIGLACWGTLATAMACGTGSAGQTQLSAREDALSAQSAGHEDDDACTVDADCDSDEACTNGVCQDLNDDEADDDDDDDSDACLVDADCDSDEACTKGVCEDKEDLCTIDTDCDSDEVCTAGVCQDSDEEDDD